MEQQRFESGKAPQITITQCQGDLVIRSWADPAVLVKGNNFQAVETETGLSISSSDKLKLMVPAAAAVSVAKALGDVVIKHVSGSCALKAVNGDLILSGLGSVEVDSVLGDLSAKNLDGSMMIGRVNGDIAMRNVGQIILDHVYGDMAARFINGSITLNKVSGDISLNTVSGDLDITTGQRDANLRNLGGVTKLANIQGDIRLRGGLRPGKHSFTAQGDIIVKWPTGEPLNLTATAPSITNRLQLEDTAENGNTLTGRLGDGETTLFLTAGRHIVLKDVRMINEKWENDQVKEAEFEFGFDLHGFGAKISSQVSEHLARATAEVERAMRRAEKSMSRARWQAGSGPRPTSAKPPERKASHEEQLKILQMVEKGIISPDEAATLLDALKD
ncbi:MAG: DUF4097 domain-containing protein [Anaerolineae bacterium]